MTSQKGSVISPPYPDECEDEHSALDETHLGHIVELTGVSIVNKRGDG
jgi:hypothetical protein